MRIKPYIPNMIDQKYSVFTDRRKEEDKNKCRDKITDDDLEFEFDISYDGIFTVYTTKKGII